MRLTREWLVADCQSTAIPRFNERERDRAKLKSGGRKNKTTQAKQRLLLFFTWGNEKGTIYQNKAKRTNKVNKNQRETRDGRRLRDPRIGDWRDKIRYVRRRFFFTLPCSKK